MLRLVLESAPYTELDFPRFNPEGFRRIQQAVEMAQQRKTLAQSAEELQHAANSLRDVVERKSLEQRIAQQAFEILLRQAFGALQTLQTNYWRAGLRGSHRREVETRIDHLVTLFNLKDFDAVLKQIPTVAGMLLSSKPVRFIPASPVLRVASIVRPPESATALFLRAQQMERTGDLRSAVDLYGQVLQRNPLHFQAVHGLNPA